MTQARGTVRLFLGGDVMTGRGIDQILAHPGDPTLHEGYMTSALGYVTLAGQRNGPIPRRADPTYVWGDLLPALQARQPHLRLVNLETAITTSDTPWPKGINYRMHPANVGVLTALGLDAVSLANNHVLDWGRDGLAETLDVLERAGIPAAGAGRDAAAAASPLLLRRGDAQATLIAAALGDSGVPPGWRAEAHRSGVALLPPDPDRAAAVVQRVLATTEPAGSVILSIHWGGNWGYDVPHLHRRLAHALIDEAGIDLVHGHSSHHPKAAEVHQGRLILYGCGDLLNDYEGIGGRDAYRSDLVLAYLVDLDAGTGELLGLEMLPFCTSRFRLARAADEASRWLVATLGHEAARFGATLAPTADGTLRLLTHA